MTIRRTLPVLHNPPTLSKSGLLLSPCIAWARPEAKWYDEDRVDAEDTTKRDLGIAFHEILDYANNGIAKPVPPELTKQVSAALAYRTDLELRCESLQSEVPISINWETGEVEVLHVKNREYPERPGWQNGTADLVGILNDGSLYVGDWKTGGNEGAEEQLLSLACGLQKVTLELGSIDGQLQWERPRKVRIACLQVNEDGVWVHEREVSQAELDAHWDAMRFQWEDIGKRNDYVPGIHCTTLYCPHLGYCPAVEDSVRRLANEPDQSGKKVYGPPVMGNNYSDAPSNPTQAGETMAIVSAAKRQIKYIEAGLKDYVKKGGRVIIGGFEWKDRGNGFRWGRD